MSERSKLISRLLNERDFRAAYIRGKLDVLIPSQLRALRLRQEKTQPEVAQMANMMQSRISAMETPGRVNFNLETLVRIAATLKVGLIVKFVSFSEMLRWENEYSQDTFDVAKLEEDVEFLRPPRTGRVRRRARRSQRPSQQLGFRSGTGVFQMQAVGVGIQLSAYGIPPQQERTQLRLQFDSFEPPLSPIGLPELITLLNRRGATPNPQIFRAERIYGT
jgi:transcriptional regulator with XRE-family HTH domain